MADEDDRDDARKPVPDELRARLLLWCDRHCCFCGKNCGVDIEIHHIDGNPGNNDPDNLTPVCYDCHARIPRYDAGNPRGTKIRDVEVKTRREQVYEEHTRRYVEPVQFELTRDPTTFGHIVSAVANLGHRHAVRVQSQLVIFNEAEKLNLWPAPDLYNGGALWNFNPEQGMQGHFQLPLTRQTWKQPVRIECFLAIVDWVGRPHVQLPFSFVWGEIDVPLFYDPRVERAQRKDVRAELWPHSHAWK